MALLAGSPPVTSLSSSSLVAPCMSQLSGHPGGTHTQPPQQTQGKEKGFHLLSWELTDLCHPCSPHRALHSPHTWLTRGVPGPTAFLNEFCNKKGALGWLEVWFFISQSYLTGNHAVMTLRRQRQLPGPGAGRSQGTSTPGTPWCPCHTCTRAAALVQQGPQPFLPVRPLGMFSCACASALC